ncbi:MAG: WD40 repeat domain-containing protein [Vulcanimicrobiota bacterium]
MRIFLASLLTVLLVADGWAQEPALTFATMEFASVSFSRDGSRLLVFDEGSRDYYVWEVATQRLVAHQRLDFAILGAELSPDGKLLALGERPRRLAVLDLANKKRVFLHQGPTPAKGQDSGGYGVAWSSRGDRLAAWGTGFMREAGEPKCYVFSWPQQKLLRTFEVERQGVQCGWSEAGQLLVRSFAGLRVFDPVGGGLLETLDEEALGSQEYLHRLSALGMHLSGIDAATGRQSFPGSPVTVEPQSGRSGPPRVVLFHGADELGRLEGASNTVLSPNGKVMAVVSSSAVFLVDVEATLATRRLVMARRRG